MSIEHQLPGFRDDAGRPRAHSCRLRRPSIRRGLVRCVDNIEVIRKLAVARGTIAPRGERFPKSGFVSVWFNRHDSRNWSSVPLDDKRVSAMAYLGQDVPEVTGKLGGPNRMFHDSVLYRVVRFMQGELHLERVSRSPLPSQHPRLTGGPSIWPREVATGTAGRSSAGRLHAGCRSDHERDGRGHTSATSRALHGLQPRGSDVPAVKQRDHGPA